jgi:diguanylate cyclase (GGDEF)-like protein
MPYGFNAQETIRPLIAPLVILLAAGVLAALLPASAVAVAQHTPYLMLAFAAAIALWFNRGRPFFVLVSLLFAYVGLRLAAEAGTFALRATFIAAATFVPLNILVVLLTPERGVFHYRSYRWLLLLAAEAILTAWIAAAGSTPISGTAWHSWLNNWLLRPAPTPLVGRLMLAAALLIALSDVVKRREPVEIGICGTLIALFIATNWSHFPGLLALFFSAAGAIGLLSVLQESHRMAFRDQLTGLPGRRALEEQLAALGPLYSIAMVDIDHFKRFNDTHGHDVGDQVLRLVGARLAEVDGGGRAYRYGGEEFSILFATSLRDALPHLEKLRTTIERYALKTRREQRRRQPRTGLDRRNPLPKQPPGSQDPSLQREPSWTVAAEPESVSVTVSIGIAEPSFKLTTPRSVIKAADEALYRAKQSGRNRISI